MRKETRHSPPLRCDIALLRRLDAGGIERAIGLAATQSAGMRLHFGTGVKPLHAGLQSVIMAEAGLSVATGILDGPNGFFALFGFDGSTLDRVSAN